MAIRIITAALILLTISNQAVCQGANISEQADSAKKPHKRPWVVGGYSALLPGAGQIYNKHYLKVPLIWTGIVLGGYTYSKQHKLYKQYSRAYILKSQYLSDTLNHTDPFPQYSNSYLKRWRDRHYMFQVAGLVTLGTSYMVNIVEAFASAQPYHNPRSATLMSTLLPGSGQIYNKKYWKVPLIYGGFGTLIYFAQLNHKYFLKYKELYNKKIASQANQGAGDPLPLISAEAILNEREYWRRNRDLNYIGIGLLYVLNVIDANVDAHLAEYDISDDLSMHITPTIMPYATNHNNTPKSYYGVTMAITF